MNYEDYEVIEDKIERQEQQEELEREPDIAAEWLEQQEKEARRVARSEAKRIAGGHGEVRTLTPENVGLSSDHVIVDAPRPKAKGGKRSLAQRMTDGFYQWCYSGDDTKLLECVKEQDGARQLVGLAIPYNVRSTVLGNFVEIASPGLVTRSLKEQPDVLALRDHNSASLIARTTAGTLQLRDTSAGLAFSLVLPNTELGRDTYENVRLQNLTGVSWGFNVPKGGDSWAKDSDGTLVRTLRDINLAEISVTSFPAYGNATSVSVRSCPPEFRGLLDYALDLFDEDGDDSDIDDDTELDEDGNPRKKKKSEDDDDEEENSDVDFVSEDTMVRSAMLHIIRSHYDHY